MERTPLTSVQLVELVLRHHPEMKIIGPELVARTPDEAASRRVETAYREGLAPAWLAAYLLGCVGHAVGLPLLDELLRLEDRTAVASAASALVRVDGEHALPRLEAILFDAPKLWLREAAAHALALARPPNLRELVLRAAAEQKVRPSTGSHCMRDVAVEPEQVRALLTSREEHAIRLGTALVLDHPERMGANARVREALVSLLADTEHRMRSSSRVALTALVRRAS